ncbi:MAG: glycosyltransferase family 9 protein [Elusimicrobiota bacterium]|jgi:heptosyltransferase-3
MNEQTEPRKILVIMLRRIGDVLLTAPAARALRKAFPQARVDLLCEPPADVLLRASPDVSSVVSYDSSLIGTVKALAWIRGARYDWVVDYLGTPRSALLCLASGASLRAGPAQVTHRWGYTRLLRESPEPCYSALEKIRVLRRLGVDVDESDCLPRLSPPAPARAFAQEAFRRLFPGAGRVVGLIPASRRETRRWPVPRYAELGRLLRDRFGARLCVFWGPGERALAEELASLIGTDAAISPPVRDLLDLAAMLGRCDLVVSNCNGPRHIAAACGVPTVTVYGSSDPACWNPPDRERHPAVRREGLPCIGCGSNDCGRGIECLRDLPAQAVFEAAARILSSENKTTGREIRCP